MDVFQLWVKRSGLILFCSCCNCIVFVCVWFGVFLCLGFDLEYVVVFNMSSIWCIET
jgi:hypothetical protein